MKWGLSVLDWQAHAIDERRYHPVGVFKAECGHLLMMVVQLHDPRHSREHGVTSRTDHFGGSDLT